MATVMTAEEWCELTGSDLQGLKAAIEEADSDTIAKESLDPETFRWLTPNSEARAREFLRRAGCDV